MKIIHVIVGLDVGGAELMLKRLAESFSKKSSYEIIVISLTSEGLIGPSLKDLGVKVISLGVSKFNFLFSLFKLTKIIKDERPDIVQTWMYHSDLIGGLAARLAGCKNVIWGIRTTEIKIGNSRLTPLIRTLCAKLSHQIPKVIVCAANASKEAHALIGYDKSKMIIVPNGFETNRFYSNSDNKIDFKKKIGIAADCIIVGHVGRFNEDKDHRNFISAAGILASKKKNVRFLMIGRDVSGENGLISHWAAETKHPNRFYFFGERNDIPDCLAAMDIFCLSSKTEGFPNVVGEAMASGIPCVVTNVGDAAYLVADTGIVVAKEHDKELSEGIQKLLDMDDRQRKALGEKARSRIFSEFTIEQCCKKFESIYKSFNGIGTF